MVELMTTGVAGTVMSVIVCPTVQLVVTVPLQAGHKGEPAVQVKTTLEYDCAKAGAAAKRRPRNKLRIFISLHYLVDQEGLEPSTFCLQSSRSPLELRAHFKL
jgi:hypothetical protein